MPKHKSESRAPRRKDAPYEDRQLASRGGGDDERRGRGGRAHKQDDTEPCPTFDAMHLKPDLLKGVYAYGFEKPSAIQQRAIRPIVRGRDVIAQSQSGTGKTAVFSISALQLLDETSRDTQVLVLSPTRELAEQTQRVMQSLGDFMNVRACKIVFLFFHQRFIPNDTSWYLVLTVYYFSTLCVSRLIVMLVLEVNLWGPI
jgi:ATP-dependent helicase YprA (DUF1998 family)